MSPHTDIPHDFDPSPEKLARLFDGSASRDISTWCIFDNTTLGAATVDGLIVKSHLLNSERVTR